MEAYVGARISKTARVLELYIGSCDDLWKAGDSYLGLQMSDRAHDKINGELGTRRLVRF
jgi:hypothetical protein